MTGTRKESVLTCVSLQQAQDVIDRLFDMQLISRAEIIPTTLKSEVKIILENLEEDLLQIKQEVASLTGADDRILEI